MIGKCVFLLIFTSLVYSAAAGDISVLSGAVIEGCSSAVNLIFSMCGMMCLWCGILEVLKKAGAIGKLSSVMAPLLRFIFPDSASHARLRGHDRRNLREHSRHRKRFNPSRPALHGNAGQAESHAGESLAGYDHLCGTRYGAVFRYAYHRCDPAFVPRLYRRLQDNRSRLDIFGNNLCFRADFMPGDRRFT